MLVDLTRPNLNRCCICCGFEIKPVHGNNEDKPWQGMWLDGVVDKIAANYGSELDGDMYVIAVCDSCIRAKLKDGTVEYAGSYMGATVKNNIMIELNIKLEEYDYQCGDGCCDTYGTVTTVNGIELPCHNQDTETIVKQILEHLGYKVNFIESDVQ